MKRALFVVPVLLLVALVAPAVAQDPVKVDSKYYQGGVRECPGPSNPRDLRSSREVGNALASANEVHRR